MSDFLNVELDNSFNQIDDVVINDNAVDPNMVWPHVVDGTLIDDEFLITEPPNDLIEFETLSTTQDFYLYELLKQFPYLIGKSARWCYMAEKEQSRMRLLIKEAEQDGFKN